MLIEGVKLSDGTVIPLAVDADGKLLVGGITLDAGTGLAITNPPENPVPVTGALTDAQLRATAVPVSVPGLAIPSHDYIGMSYTNSNLTGVVYKTGGSGGTTVATLTLGYTNDVLTSVTKS